MDILTKEPVVRLSAFLGVLVIMSAWEVLAPRRKRVLPRLKRWPSNIGIVVVDSFAVRLLAPLVAVGIARFTEARQIGFLHLVEMPVWAEMAIAIVFLDLIIYLQHVLFHAVPRLWSLHHVHHADLDIDVTTGLRFHPIEILISLVIKAGAIFILGPTAVAVLIFEVILNASAMFNHSNARLPLFLDRVLRVGIVTPDMHRVHHSVVVKETNSNFGFFLSFWDRVFGTYVPQPRAGHEGMTIGLVDHQTPRTASLLWMLLAPFRQGRDTYSFKGE